MLILSSPSGAGKTTLSDRLLKILDDMVLSVSATTRSPRPGEVHGKDYFFVSEEEFLTMQSDGKFLEHARVFENYYGTPKAPVFEALEAGKDVLFDIDWQGAQQLEEVASRDVVKVFVLPPSRSELERRLKTRNQDSDEIVQSRMAKADDEMSHWPEYDYVIINDDMDQSEETIKTILMAERQKRFRQVALSKFVNTLMDKE
ncbi:MAG: guanylate kinase [Pseudomonadota bacterium]